MFGIINFLYQITKYWDINTRIRSCLHSSLIKYWSITRLFSWINYSIGIRFVHFRKQFCFLQMSNWSIYVEEYNQNLLNEENILITFFNQTQYFFLVQDHFEGECLFLHLTNQSFFFFTHLFDKLVSHLV